jgi:calcineurin-like phosphoesterase
VPFEVATGDVKMNGVLVIVDSNSRKAEHIERVRIDAAPDASAETTRYDSDDGRPEYYNNFE